MGLHGPDYRPDQETDRQARNRIAKACAELHSENDDLRARIALLEPVALAAVAEDHAELMNDNPLDCGLGSRLALNLAREVRQMAVVDYHDKLLAARTAGSPIITDEPVATNHGQRS